MSLQQLASRLEESFATGFVKAVEWRGELAVTVMRDRLHDVAQFLRDDPAMDFDYIVHVSSVDWPDDEERFEVVYSFLH
jgi:NADH-quinone oxidoreductase subunit C